MNIQRLGTFQSDPREPPHRLSRVVVGGVGGRLADGVRQDTGSQVTIQMRMLCRVIGGGGDEKRLAFSPSTGPCPKSRPVHVVDNVRRPTLLSTTIVTSPYAVDNARFFKPSLAFTQPRSNALVRTLLYTSKQ